MTLPAAVTLVFVVLPWRQAVMLLGGLGAIAAIAIFIAIPRFRMKPPRPEKVMALRVQAARFELTASHCFCRSA